MGTFVMSTSTAIEKILDRLLEKNLQPNSSDAFCECQTLGEAIELYLYNLKAERSKRIRLDRSEPDYFLDFIIPAEIVKILWLVSRDNPDEFKVMIDRAEGEDSADSAVPELGNALLEQDFCSLAFGRDKK